MYTHKKCTNVQLLQYMYTLCIDKYEYGCLSPQIFIFASDENSKFPSFIKRNAILSLFLVILLCNKAKDLCILRIFSPHSSTYPHLKIVNK